MDSSRKPTAWMMPDFRKDNPYQTLLAQGIESASTWEVLFYSHYKRGLPFNRGLSTLPAKPDLLHLHWLNPYQKGSHYLVQLFYKWKVLLDLSILQARGIPYVWTFHNLLSHDTRYPGLEKSLFRKLAIRSKAVLLHQESAALQFQEMFPEARHKTVVIPHGHYRDCYGPLMDKREARRRLKLPEDRKLILFFGMLRPYKGIETLMDCWIRHEEEMSGAQLLIAGNPQEESFASQIRASASRSDSIILHDHFIPNEEVNAYFSAADGAVFPFQKILTSGSVILALSYGVPVIAPDFPTIRETVEPLTEGLYEEGNPEALAACLRQACQEDLEVNPESLEQIADRLDWKKIGSATAEVYTRAINGQG